VQRISLQHGERHCLLTGKKVPGQRGVTGSIRRGIKSG
jgi:hypothetical protein